MKRYLWLCTAMGLLIADTDRTLISAESVPKTAAPEGASAAMSSISPDEFVVFFQTSAHLDPEGKMWTVPIHGIIYEPELGSRRRNFMVRAIKRSLRVKDGTPEAKNLNQRLRLFLVDNERGQDISVLIGDQSYYVGKSGPNGHFYGSLQFSAAHIQRLLDSQESENGILSFAAVTRESDDRAFTGRVQFVGRTGLSIISDIDDTIKHSQVGNHRAVLRNTFLHQFKLVPGMAGLYRDCEREGMVFHYVSGSPWQLYLPLQEFLRTEGLPTGSFDLKYFRLKDSSAFGLLRSQQATKRRAIEPIMASFPQRRFILIGDSGEQDPEIYRQIARKHSPQIVAIFIRNVTEATSDDARFQQLRDDLTDVRFHLFDQPDELRPILFNL